VRGEISVDRPGGIYPVVGGTGRFAGARGTSAFRSLSSDRALNVDRIRVP
jgi:hypothetical protein